MVESIKMLEDLYNTHKITYYEFMHGIKLALQNKL